MPLADRHVGPVYSVGFRFISSTLAFYCFLLSADETIPEDIPHTVNATK